MTFGKNVNPTPAFEAPADRRQLVGRLEGLGQEFQTLAALLPGQSSEVSPGAERDVRRAALVEISDQSGVASNAGRRPCAQTPRAASDLSNRDLSRGCIEQIPRHHLGTWGRVADVRRRELIGRIARRGTVVDNQGREREAGQIVTLEVSGNDPAADPRLVIDDYHAVDHADDPVAGAEAIHVPTARGPVRV